jgi:hypothetical protein
MLTALHPRHKGITGRSGRIYYGRAGEPHTNLIASGMPHGSDDKKEPPYRPGGSFLLYWLQRSWLTESAHVS